METNRRALVAAAVSAVLLTAAPTGAQDRLFLDGYELGAHGRFGQRLGRANGLDGPLIGGGRFAVTDVAVVDLRTGARRPLPVGATVAALDPAKPRLLLALPPTGPAGTVDVAVFEVVTGVVETIVPGACRSGLIGAGPVADYAYAAEMVIAARCSAVDTVRDLVAVELGAQPRTLRVLPITPPPGLQMRVSSNGRRLFVGVSSLGGLAIDAYDVSTGALVGSVNLSVGGFGGGEMRWDETGERLFVVAFRDFDSNDVHALGPNLERLGTAAISTRVCRVRIQISPHTRRVYLTTDGTTSTTAQPTRLEVFEGVPLRRVGVALPPMDSPSCAGAVLRTAPGPPRELQATVTGRDVALDWANVGGASAFVLDVGLAPGRTDVSVPLGPDSNAAVAGVPPGTYYVRVRGGNEFGGGRPSSELRVVVP